MLDRVCAGVWGSAESRGRASGLRVRPLIAQLKGPPNMWLWGEDNKKYRIKIRIGQSKEGD